MCKYFSNACNYRTLNKIGGIKMEIAVGKVFKTELKLKRVKSTRWIKQAKIACCQHYAAFEQLKAMMKKAIANKFNKVTVNVTLSEEEFSKFLQLANENSFILDIDLGIVRKINAFIDIED